MTSLAGLLDFGRLGFGQQSAPELVVVTGAGSGIGRATAAEFGARGSRVVCADINLESAVDTADAIPDGLGVARRLDVADPDEWERFGAYHLAPPLMRLATRLRADTLLRYAPVSAKEGYSTTLHSRVEAR